MSHNHPFLALFSWTTLSVASFAHTVLPLTHIQCRLFRTYSVALLHIQGCLFCTYSVASFAHTVLPLSYTQCCPFCTSSADSTACIVCLFHTYSTDSTACIVCLFHTYSVASFANTKNLGITS